MERTILVRSIGGVSISIVIFLLLINIFNVSLNEILSFPIDVLALLIILCYTRILAQDLRLHILVRYNSRVRLMLWESILIRGSSEFFALTTLPFLADEVARTIMLVERGESRYTAFWIASVEMILDVLVGASIAITSGLYALLANHRILASIILSIALLQISLAAMLLIASSRLKSERLQEVVDSIRQKISIPYKLYPIFRDGAIEYSRIFNSVFSRKNMGKLTILKMLTVLVMSIPSIILFILLSGSIWLLETLLSFHAANTFGVLPVTVGGSGLTESGLYIYMFNVLRAGSWPLTIRWRIVTYYLTLIITASMFIYFSVRIIRKDNRGLS
ncbi:MAG: lysylphosphatidylglycerol synthase domain-containing protein [Candidatus Caldarchaeales archaeon]